MSVKYQTMKRLSIFLSLFLLGGSLYAQEEKNAIRLSVPVFILNGAMRTVEFAPQLEYSRVINECLSGFVYAGMGFHEESLVKMKSSEGLTSVSTTTGTALYYGVGFRLHVLPIFSASNVARRIDPYVSASFGGNNMFHSRKGMDRLREVSSQNTSPDEIYNLVPGGWSFEQISAVGLNFYITQRVGLWGELGYRQSRHRVGLHWNAGLAVRF